MPPGSKGESAISSQISKRRKLALSEGGQDYTLKRDELIRIAAQLFRERGYQATRLGDVATLAGIDRASIYYYIESKEELLRDSMAGILGGNLANAQTIADDQSLTVTDRLRRVFEMLMRSYDENYPQMFVYIQEQMGKIAREPSPWSKEIIKNTRKFELMVTSLIEAGIANGEIRTHVPAKLASYAIFGMFNWTHRWYMPGGVKTAAEISGMFLDIFFDGVSTKQTAAKNLRRQPGPAPAAASSRKALLSTLVEDIGQEPAATKRTKRGIL